MPKDKIATESYVKEVVDKAIELAVEKLQEEIKSSHNDIIEKLDSIAGQIKDLDEDHAVLSMHSSENYDKLEDHEKRINKLEAVLPV